MSAACPTFGFLVVVKPHPGLAPGARDAFWTAWAQLLRSRGLYSRAHGSEERTSCVVMGEAAQATDADRSAVHAWLAARSELREWSVGDLEDLNPSA